MSKGLFIEWNADYYQGHQSTSGGSGRVRIIAVLKPGLNVKMNIPKRQEYCAKNGIPFELPMQNPPTGANPQYPPPTMGPGPYPPATAPPPYYPNDDGKHAGFYPPPTQPMNPGYPQPMTQGYPPPTQPMMPQYGLPVQQEQPRQYAIEVGPSRHHHHHHHDSISIGSNSP